LTRKGEGRSETGKRRRGSREEKKKRKGEFYWEGEGGGEEIAGRNPGAQKERNYPSQRKKTMKKGSREKRKSFRASRCAGAQKEERRDDEAKGIMKMHHSWIERKRDRTLEGKKKKFTRKKGGGESVGAKVAASGCPLKKQRE